MTFLILVAASFATAYAAVETSIPEARRDMTLSSIFFGISAFFNMVAMLL